MYNNISRYIIIFFHVLFILSFSPLDLMASYVEFKDELYGFFPGINNLTEGTAHWLTGEVEEVSNTNMIKLTKEYSFFSSKTEKFWGIERKKQFNITATIYILNNFIRANNLFDNFSTTTQGELKEATPFGDKGYFIITPISKINLQTKYKIILQSQTFIIEILSSDGFALMDFAYFVYGKTLNFIYSHMDLFFMDRIRVKCSAKNYMAKIKELTLINKDIDKIIILGAVTNVKGDPIKNALIEIIELGQKTYSDSKGNYRFEMDLGGNKDIKLTKHFALISDKIEAFDNRKNMKFYNINVDYSQSNKIEKINLKIISNRRDIYGEIYSLNNEIVNKNIAIKNIDDKNIDFTRDCTPPGSSFRCIQDFSGQIKDNAISGKWKGTGGGGFWNGVLNADLVKKSVDLTEAGYNIGTIVINNESDILAEKATSTSFSSNKNLKEYMFLTINEDSLSDFFTKSIGLILTHMPGNSGNAPAPFYKIIAEKNGNNIQFKTLEKIGDLTSSDEPYKVKIDITDDIDLITKNLSNNDNSSKLILLGLPKNHMIETKHKFAGNSSYSNIRPKIVLQSYANHDHGQNKPLEITLEQNGSGYDHASNSNYPKKDGKTDLQLNFYTGDLSGILKYLEINSHGKSPFKWNTDANDIYPAIVTSRDNHILTQKNGDTILDLKKNEILTLFIYKPPYFNINENELTFNIVTTGGSEKGTVK